MLFVSSVMDHNSTNFDLKWKNIWNLYLINNMKTTLMYCIQTFIDSLWERTVALLWLFYSYGNDKAISGILCRAVLSVVPDQEFSLRRKFVWKASWPIVMKNLPFLSDKQSSQESISMLWTWKMVYWRVCAVETMPSDVHSCLFRAITSKEEEMIGSCAAWTEALQRSVTTH